MPNNYVLLEKITVGAAGASSVTFANIPQTGYTDLVVKVSARSDRAANQDVVIYKFNSSTASYSYRQLYGGAGSGPIVTGSTSGTPAYQVLGVFPATNNTASTFGNQELFLPNYAGSTNKSTSSDSVAENNAATNFQLDLIAGLWSNTAAITSIQFLTENSANFVANSTFYLYGVAKLGTTPAIAPKATGGDVVMTDGTYWYHQFNSSGTFTPALALSCDYLVVAGGGGGGGNIAGGGGAGGLRSTVTATGGGGSLETALSLGASAYTVTIGAGGAGGTMPGNNPGTIGSNSVFSTITSTGGGYGGPGAIGTGVSESGGPGGSGGGAGGSTATSGRAGGTRTASPVQGFNGGANTFGSATDAKASGGGGAGAVGANGGSGAAGNGGAGVAVSITGSSVNYAGGGGGGSQGTGSAGTASFGGGAGSTTDTVGTAGTANTGGGGGGGGRSGSGGPGAAGGSGIVIVRYSVA